jgi:3-hydroxyisobutyrate dehydrogenase-like beta-hydroxyacid dehydrogenase
LLSLNNKKRRLKVNKMNVGFIGLGKMGGGMASNILKAGFPLTIFVRRPELAREFLEKGARLAESPKAMAAASEIIFTSLPGPKEVEEVALGANGLIEGVKSGSVLFDTSTVSPGLADRLQAVFKEKGVQVMDAPVSGGPDGAREGKLIIMVGGDEETFDRYKYILDIIGNRVKYTGKIGSGLVCKLMHNCMSYGFLAVMAECFTLAVKSGVEPEVIFQIISETLGKGTLITHVLPQTYLSGHFEPPRFTLNLAVKDVQLAVDLAKNHGVPTAQAELTLRDMLTAMEKGWGEKDSRVFMLVQEERAGGVEVRLPRS